MQACSGSASHLALQNFYDPPVSVLVTVQVVETAITPLLAPAERWRGGERGPRPPVEPRPPLECETPSAGAAVVARSPPRSAGVRRTGSRPHAACPRCPGAPARRAGSTARAPGGLAPYLRLARTAPAPRAAPRGRGRRPGAPRGPTPGEAHYGCQRRRRRARGQALRPRAQRAWRVPAGPVPPARPSQRRPGRRGPPRCARGPCEPWEPLWPGRPGRGGGGGARAGGRAECRAATACLAAGTAAEVWSHRAGGQEGGVGMAAADARSRPDRQTQC